MSKRKLSEILIDTLPSSSNEQYLKRWKLFISFKNGEEGIINEDVLISADDKPTEENYLQYFDYLNRIEKKKASTTPSGLHPPRPKWLLSQATPPR